MSKELKALNRIETFLKENCKHYKQDIGYIKQALKRLEAIDNANPNEALERVIEGAVYDHIYTKQDLEQDVNSIKQALLKAQEQEKIVKEYDLKPYELREALLLYAMYKGEYKGNPLPKLKQAQEQEKVLEIITQKRIDIESFYTTFIKNCYDYNFYERNYGTYGLHKLTQEEFELLKRWLDE